MSLKRHTHPSIIIALVIGLSFLIGTTDVLAQKRLELRRTQRKSNPVMVQLYAGYNGMSNPADTLQNLFINRDYIEWSGLMLGVQTLIPVDTLGLPMWIGLDFYYHRMAKRFLRTITTVFYKSDSSRVYGEERLGGYGANLLIAFDIISRFQLQLGGGIQYLDSEVNVESEVVGLFESQWIPSVAGSINIELLKYEHGSIDANFRVAKSFGTFGSIHFQSLLGFTFDF